MNNALLPTGTAVTVATELGSEAGIVLGHSNPAAGHLRYTVQFADRTQSSWAAFQVHAA